MDELREISSDQEKADVKMCLYVKHCLLLGASSICIDTGDTGVLVLSFYYYVHADTHFLTLNFPSYISILRKSEEHLLNVSNADYENNI